MFGTRPLLFAPFLLAPIAWACGGEASEEPPPSPLPPAPAPWLGDWPVGYGLDLSEVVHIPDASPEAHPFRALWPDELLWLRPVAEPVLEAWLQAQLTGGLADFFVEVEALPARLAGAELEADLRLEADGQVIERWRALRVPDACGGRGLRAPLSDFQSAEGAWWQESGRLFIERRLRFRGEAFARALLDGAATCAGYATVGELLDQSLECEFEDWSPELRGIGGVLCAGLRQAWADKYTPRGATADWVLHQSQESGPLRGGGEEVLVTTSAEVAPRLSSWRIR